MKKQTRIGLMVFVTLVLLLAFAIPALAISPKSELCWIPWWAHTKDKNTDFYDEHDERPLYLLVSHKFQRHAGLDPASRSFIHLILFWIPAFAGMTTVSKRFQ